MMTPEEAVSFVEGVMGVTDIKNAIQTNRLDALNSLMYPYQKVAPFQNITLLAAPIHSTTTPTWTQVASDIKTKQGGLCFTLNYFFGELLKALGYEVSWASCNINKVPGNHIAIYVHDLVKPGDRSLVDVGCAQPAHFAIPLDFTDWSPVYTSGFLVFKFNRENGIVSRYRATHPGSEAALYPNELPTIPEETILWQLVYDMGDAELEAIKYSIRAEYEDCFLERLLVTQYLDGKMCGLRTGKSERTMGKLVYFDYSPEKQNKTIVRTKEVMERLKQLLPWHREQTIRDAIANMEHYRQQTVENEKSHENI